MGLPASVQIRLLAFIFFPSFSLSHTSSRHECLAALAALAPNSLTLSCVTARPLFPRRHPSSSPATQLLASDQNLPLSAASTSALSAAVAPARTPHRRLSLQSYAICLHVCSSSVHSAPHCLSTHSGLTEAVLRPGTRNPVPPLSEQPLLASNLGEHWFCIRDRRSLSLGERPRSTLDIPSSSQSGLSQN